MAKQDVKVELFYDNQWNGIAATAPVYNRDGITITRGRQDETSQPAPMTASLTIGNKTGKYNPKNPTSELYGKIGRNTPLRIYTGTPHPGASNADLADTTSHVAPSIDSPTNDALLLCAWGAPDAANSYTLPIGMTSGQSQQGSNGIIKTAYQSISASGSTGSRTATFGVAEDYVSASALLHGTSPTVQESEGDSNKLLSTNIGTQPGWYIVLFSYYAWNDSSLTPDDFPEDDDGGGWIPVADTGTRVPNDPDAVFMRMKAWIKRVKTGGAFDIRLGDTGIGTRSVMHVVSGVSDWSIRFIGEVSSWTPRRAIDNNDAWVEVVASSQLRRFSQGADPFRNSLDRWIRTKSPVGYWPLDDPEGSTHARAVVGEDIPLTGSSLFAIARGWSEGRTFPWLGSAYRFRINNFFRSGPLSGGGDISALAADIIYMHQPGPNLMTGISLRTTDSSGNATDWFVSFDLASGTNAPDTAEISVLVNTFAGPILLNTTGTSETLIDGNPHHVRFLLTQSGANVTVSVLIDGSAVSLGSSTVASTQVGRIDRGLTLYTPSVTVQDGQVDISNFVVWYSTIPSVVDAIDAMRGYSTETADSRIRRLSQEEGISLALVGNSGDTAAVGPQYPDTFLSIIREAADTDAGALLDQRTSQGTLFRTLNSLYNQDPTLELDFSNEEFAEPLEPIIDDYDTRNDITVTRRDGGSARAVLESGTMSVQPPPDGIGRTRTQVEVNCASDAVLADQAGWRLHLGTVDEIRFPQITVDLDRHPELAATASALDVGDRIAAINLPDDITPDTVNLLVQGYTETIYSHRRKITFICTPESPYRVFVLDNDVLGRLDTSGSALESAINTAVTTISVETTAGPIWTTDVADLDFTILAGGEVMRVTAVSGSVSPQQFTVVRSVNGVVKSHPAGQLVQLSRYVVA